MNRTALTLAAALVTGATFTNAAEAGGLRLGFGMPLGSFVAHSLSQESRHSGYSSGRSGYERMQEQRAARAAKVAAAKREAAKRQAIAEAEARARKAKAVAAAQATTENVEIKTAKIEDKTTATDAAPTIYVPTAPAVVDAPKADAEVAKVGAIDDAVKIEAPKTEELKQVVTIEKPAQPVTVEKVETKPTETTSAKAQRICRRFSAAIAGLVDIPCE
ncbi:MAG: hypothetical protein ACT4OU_05290 [Hyphomicrobium sp.]